MTDEVLWKDSFVYQIKRENKSNLRYAAQREIFLLNQGVQNEKFKLLSQCAREKKRLRQLNATLLLTFLYLTSK